MFMSIEVLAIFVPQDKAVVISASITAKHFVSTDTQTQFKAVLILWKMSFYYYYYYTPSHLTYREYISSLLSAMSRTGHLRITYCLESTLTKITYRLNKSIMVCLSYILVQIIHLPSFLIYIRL